MTETFLTDWSPSGGQSVLNAIHHSCYNINLWNIFREQETQKHCADLHNDVFETNRSNELFWIPSKKHQAQRKQFNTIVLPENSLDIIFLYFNTSLFTAY